MVKQCLTSDQCVWEAFKHSSLVQLGVQLHFYTRNGNANQERIGGNTER